MEPESTPDPFDYNPADAGSDRPAQADPRAEPAAPSKPSSRKRKPKTQTPPRQFSTDPALPHGVIGILRDYGCPHPLNTWSALRFRDESLGRTLFAEGGVVLTRDAVAEMLARGGVRTTSTQIDAATMACVYALNLLAGEILSVVCGVVSGIDTGKSPPRFREAMDAAVQRLTIALDSDANPNGRAEFVEVVETISLMFAQSQEEIDAETVRAEVVAGSALTNTCANDPSQWLTLLGGAVAVFAAKSMVERVEQQDGGEQP